MVLLEGKEMKLFKFNDKGLLFFFLYFGIVGNLMGNLVKGDMFIEGKIVCFVYFLFYCMY